MVLFCLHSSSWHPKLPTYNSIIMKKFNYKPILGISLILIILSLEVFKDWSLKIDSIANR